MVPRDLPVPREGVGRARACSSALVSLIILTCNRPAFLRLALAAASAQTYPNLEAIVVDDGSTPVPPNLLRGWRMPVRLVRLRSRASIGGKRNAAVRRARGRVLVHWDDDDMHDPRQVSALACPILANLTEITSLTFSYLATLSATSVTYYAYTTVATSRASTGPFLGSLAYSAQLAARLSHGEAGAPADESTGATAGPFAHTSLSEDLFFVERALASCHRMLPISRVPIVYAPPPPTHPPPALASTPKPRTRRARRRTRTPARVHPPRDRRPARPPPPPRYTRHTSVHNTWQPADFARRTRAEHAASPPAFVDAALSHAYVAAEAEASSLGGCVAKHRHEPHGLARPLRFPYMPPSCCASGPLKSLRRPCTDSLSGRDDCADETFCGGVKGVCTASCTCAGEAAHQRPAATPCGKSCCAYWHRFWTRHPQNCTMARPRPLKAHYCHSHSDGRRDGRGRRGSGGSRPAHDRGQP
jgi:hypothetical protein